MGQIFRRLSKLIKSELNSVSSLKNNYNDNQIQQAGLMTGGALTGASLGKVGILAGGGGFAVGALPLAIAGGLTGLALYEAIQIFVDQDLSSVGGAVTGAIGGAGVSATIGGVGVATGGSAFGMGLVGMTGVGAIAGLGLVGLYKLLNQGITIEQALDLAIDQMEDDLIKLRQAVNQALIAHKKMEQKYNQAQTEINLWEKRAKLALINNNEYLARQALLRKKSAFNTAKTLKEHINRQSKDMEKLKTNLTVVQNKFSSAKSQKQILINKIKIAQNKQKLQSNISNMGKSIALSAFECMEEKVLSLETESKSAYELAGTDLESMFAALEAGSDVDDELAMMKAQLAQRSINKETLPSLTTFQSVGNKTVSEVDAELEALRKQLDEM